METIITITAIDKRSTDTMSRSFMTNESFKDMVLEWEREVPYGRYELVTQDYMSDYDQETQDALDELEVSN